MCLKARFGGRERQTFTLKIIRVGLLDALHQSVSDEDA